MKVSVASITKLFNTTLLSPTEEEINWALSNELETEEKITRIKNNKIKTNDNEKNN